MLQGILVAQGVGLAGAVALGPDVTFVDQWESIKTLVNETVQAFFTYKGIDRSEAECLAAFETYPKDATIHKIADGIGGVVPFCKLPVLPIDFGFPRKGSSLLSDYGIAQPDRVSHSIMRGEKCGGPFIALKTEVIGKSGSRIHSETWGEQCTPFCLSKRWVRGISLDFPDVHDGLWHWEFSREEVNDDDIEQLRQLVNGETVAASSHKLKTKLYEPGIDGSEEECRAALEASPEEATIRKIANAVGGANSFCKLPVLPWDEKFRRSSHSERVCKTDIHVPPESLTDPMMRGVDSWNKPFFVAKSLLTIGRDKNDPHADVFYQQYSDRPEPWVRSSRYEGFKTVVDDEDVEQLGQLAKGETVAIPNEFMNAGSVTMKLLDK